MRSLIHGICRASFIRQIIPSECAEYLPHSFEVSILRQVVSSGRMRQQLQLETEVGSQQCIYLKVSDQLQAQDIWEAMAESRRLAIAVLSPAFDNLI